MKNIYLNSLELKIFNMDINIRKKFLSSTNKKLINLFHIVDKLETSLEILENPKINQSIQKINDELLYIFYQVQHQLKQWEINNHDKKDITIAN
ncbi:hypothetical protein BCF89_1372 [Metamycoplasma auris]|uniref:Uncharacterized protein n=2 Tax=Metamycoplasma auris TaxID=51363 RepID=A0A2W7GK23_9BACT|nr:hypothetical protein BCF89_1372 [Metamycoplasma auris]